VLAVAALVGLADAGAEVLFAGASVGGELSVVAVLASMYPAVTVGLATVLLGERAGPVQAVGVLAVLTGVVLLVT
jgi:uncharacterized membrane protein